MSALTTRPANSQDDAFLKELFFELRAPEFAPANLSNEQLQMLLSVQYQARRIFYAQNFPRAVCDILEHDGKAIGYDLWEEGDELHLIDIAVCPPFQNQGWGTERMRQLLTHAQAARKPIVLSVEISNPARRLYERLGFEPFGEAGVYQRMRCIPPGGTENL